MKNIYRLSIQAIYVKIKVLRYPYHNMSEKKGNENGKQFNDSDNRDKFKRNE